MILLTLRVYGWQDGCEDAVCGVFSSIEKAKEAAMEDIGGVIDKEEDSRGYFRIKCRSGYEYNYDWTKVELDKMVD